MNEVVNNSIKVCNLLDFTLEELEVLFVKIGEQKFRAKQVFEWIQKGIENIDEMTNISKALKEKLLQHATFKKLEIKNKLVSEIDGTHKYLFSLSDGNIIESVLMKYEHGYSICVSSQVGCKMGCKFCASSPVGFLRNLTAGEIVDQILTIQKDTGVRIGNVVIMGIGEPLDNFENILKFLRIINHKDGLNIGARHISLSTCGLVPEILKLMDEKIQITLSISLHASNDETRSDIMPINKRYSIDKIIEVCKIYTRTTKRRITFEYALINGVNDTVANAVELSKMLRKMLCHVNLIPMNEVDGSGLSKSSKKSVEKFKEILERNGITATVRRELGSDINAACGQLRRSYIENTANN